MASIINISNEQIDPKWKKGFVRVGKCPVGGKSYNYREGHYEDGISVFPAWLSQDGGLRALDLTEVNVVSALCILDTSDSVGIFEVVGNIVGTGSDGEPVIKKTSSRKIPKKAIAPRIRALINV